MIIPASIVTVISTDTYSLSSKSAVDNFINDNLICSKAKVVQDFTTNAKIKILHRPAKSPDLNIVEDIWKLLSNDIYDGPQFQNTKDLKER